MMQRCSIIFGPIKRMSSSVNQGVSPCLYDIKASSYPKQLTSYGQIIGKMYIQFYKIKTKLQSQIVRELYINRSLPPGGSLRSMSTNFAEFSSDQRTKRSLIYHARDVKNSPKEITLERTTNLGMAVLTNEEAAARR